MYSCYNSIEYVHLMYVQKVLGIMLKMLCRSYSMERWLFSEQNDYI